jgi:hypothetical protein
MKITKFREIPQFPFSSYHIHVSLKYLKFTLDRWNDEGSKLILDPSYQRGYVWTVEQKTNYIEYLLRGGKAGLQIFFNNPTWMDSFNQPTELFDGKQRLSAALGFLDDKIPAFETYYSEFEDKLFHDVGLEFYVFKIKSRRELLEAYIGFNTGGSVHTEKDLAPAYEELEELKKTKI